MEKEIFQEIARRLQAGRPAELTLSYGRSTCVRRFEPQQRLILLGAGHVALALAKVAALAGFSVVVADDRPDYANRARFPMVQQVLCEDFAAVIDRLALCDADFLCTLTRGSAMDLECLRAIRQSGVVPRYLGMLGSRRRAAQMQEQLRAEGFEEAFLQFIRAPVGLPIGALTAEEIAVAICAEMIRERRAGENAPLGGCLVQTGAEPETLAVLADPNVPCALLTVVQTQGATPLKSGALMAVDKLGRGYGTIGGGVVEAAAMWLGASIIGSGERFTLQMNVSADRAADGNRQGRMCVYIEDVG